MYQRRVDKYRARRDEELLEALKGANFDTEFSLAFQPLVKGLSGELYGAEALLRWHHPVFGFVRADEFIPLAERFGVIHRITLWVVRQAVGYVTRWRAQGYSIRLAVNVSALDLERPDLMATLCTVVQSEQLTDKQLTLEVTETAAIRYPAVAAKQVQLLKAAGYRVALDDFGSGHADLMQLGHLPVCEVKLDRSLVQALEQGSSWPAMLKLVVDMAHRLGLQVVGEGVENAQTEQALQEAGCDYLQGYYFSRPLGEAELLEWVLQQSLTKGPP